MSNVHSTPYLLVYMYLPFPTDSWQWLHTLSIHCELHCWSSICHLYGACQWWCNNRDPRGIFSDDCLHWWIQCCYDWLTIHISSHSWRWWSRYMCTVRFLKCHTLGFVYIRICYIWYVCNGAYVCMYICGIEYKCCYSMHVHKWVVYIIYKGCMVNAVFV